MKIHAKPRMHAAALAVALSLAALALASACGGRPDAPPPATGAGAPIELRAPALDGGVIDIASYRGREVVIHLFTPGEPSIAGDVAELNALRDELGGEVVVVGVALEPGGYPIVSAWRRGMEVDYLLAVVSDPSELSTANIAPLEALPTTLVLDESGRLTHRVERPLRPGELREIVAGRKSRG